MQGDGGSPPEALTRREALKRGAVFGGALLWTTPAVQAIGMSRAVAQEVSGPCTTYCVKFEFTGDDDSLEGDWVPLGEGDAGNIFVCPPDSNNGPFPEGFFDDFEIVVMVSDRKTQVVVRLPDSCELADTTADSPDELKFGNVAAKCGDDGKHVQNLTGREFTVLACDNDRRAISHIELMVRCCP